MRLLTTSLVMLLCFGVIANAKILFDASPDGQSGIYVMDDDGSNITLLTEGDRAGYARWFPNGKKILFRTPDSQRVVYIQHEYTWELEKQEDVTFIHLIHKAYRYIICDKNGSTIKELNIPPNLNGGSLDWMGEDGKSVIFTARPVLLDVIRPVGTPIQNFHIYKYDLETDELTQLTHDALNYETVDWISDDVLSVTPAGKKKTQWGKLKK